MPTSQRKQPRRDTLARSVVAASAVMTQRFGRDSPLCPFLRQRRAAAAIRREMGSPTQPPMDSAASYPLATLVELFTVGFAGYVIPLQMTPATLAERVAAEDIDLAASRVVLRDGIPIGLALVARRGWESRIAATVMRLDARGHGSGRALLQRLLRDARARGDRRMRLEVVESNAPARALYERAGFRTTVRLFGYEHPALAPAEAALVPLDPATFARHLAAAEPAPLPWQLEPPRLAAPPSTARCFPVDGTAFVYVASIS